jgi:hypothetical protein
MRSWLRWLRRYGCPALAVAGLAGSVARADYVMGAAEVNTSLKNIARARASMNESAEPARKAEALFIVGAEAEDLATMINLEIASHQFEQKPLIDLAVERCGRLGVTLRFDPGAGSYSYDRAAFAEYVKLHPQGPEALHARYLLLERAFEERNPADVAALERTVREAAALRALDAERACELEFFEAVASMELAQARPAAGAARVRALRARATEAFEHVSRSCPLTPEATLSRTHLQRLAGGAAAERQRAGR